MDAMGVMVYETIPTLRKPASSMKERSSQNLSRPVQAGLPHPNTPLFECFGTTKEKMQGSQTRRGPV